MLNTIDHIIITVEDLSSAIEDYSKVLGFKPTWRGEHPEMGTENALFPLQNTGYNSHDKQLPFCPFLSTEP